MENKKFDSSLIIHGWYNGTDKELEISFPNGKKYRYYGVEEKEWKGLCSAESAGEYFSQNIKGKYHYKLLSI